MVKKLLSLAQMNKFVKFEHSSDWLSLLEGRKCSLLIVDNRRAWQIVNQGLGLDSNPALLVQGSKIYDCLTVIAVFKLLI